MIWDFDGTLVIRSGGWTGALLSVLRQNEPGLAVTAEQVRPFLNSGFPWQAPENSHPGLSPEEWWEDLLPMFIRAFRGVGFDAAARKYAAQVRATYLDLCAWQIYPDALPALDSLSEAGWTHVLLTNHVPELPLLLDHFGLSDRFAAVFNSAETGFEKPNPKAFRAVTAWTGSESATWMIGDSYTADFQGAAEAGLPAILVRHSHPNARWCCDGLGEVAAIVE